MGPAAHEFAELRPFGGFGMIMADPPWAFANWSAEGSAKNATAHYRCSRAEEIAMLPVQVLAADDCLLWLWATNPMLPEAFDVMVAWGFQFKTAGTWVKRTTHGKDAFGTGYVLRSSNEPFLIGVRGSPKVSAKNIRSSVISYESAPGVDTVLAESWPAEQVSITLEARTREHSRKPDSAFLAAEALMPGAQRLELFSRERRDGWACWGDEVGKFDMSTSAAGGTP